MGLLQAGELRRSGGLATVILLDRVTSTDVMARNVISEAVEDEKELAPTLILARSQEKGRGRRDRRWASPQGGLYFDYLRSGVSDLELRHVPICAPLAVCDALDRQGISPVGIKWPNDIMFDGGKLGGVLCHARRTGEKYFSVGIGLNLGLAPDPGPDAAWPSTGLGIEPDRLDGVMHDLVLAFIRHFEDALGKPDAGLDRWKERLVHRPGEAMTITVDGDEVFSGVFFGVDSDGRLLLETSEGIRGFPTAEVFAPRAKNMETTSS